jgi:CRISPR-associated protein Csm3
MPRIEKKILVTGKLILITGMHIGGTNSAMSIGGPDKFVVRQSKDGYPYIPGSSLKGKMRSLLELLDGTIKATEKAGRHVSYGPTDDSNTRAGKLFGTVHKEESKQHPSQIIVRDSILLNPDAPCFKNTDLPMTEAKTEVSIDRITSKANPRTFERVPSGAEFKVNMVVNVFEGDKENELLETIKTALKLVEDDYIGGQGSRGYGQVKFEELKFEFHNSAWYKAEVLKMDK